MPEDLQLPDLFTVTALVLSALAFWRSRRTDKRDLFVKVHEQLLHSELVEGRRILYRLTSVEDIEALPSEDRTKVYRLFAMYDLMAFYTERRWITARTVLAEWSDSLRRSTEPGAHFLEYRRRVTPKTWPHYEKLAELATAAGNREGMGLTVWLFLRRFRLSR